MKKFWRNVENENTHFMFNNVFPFTRYVEKYGGAREARNNKTWFKGVACWISKATRVRAQVLTHRQVCNTYCLSTATVIHERASLLRYTFTVALLFPTLGNNNMADARTLRREGRCCHFLGTGLMYDNIPWAICNIR
jgi:hypothetical protein